MIRIVLIIITLLMTERVSCQEVADYSPKLSYPIKADQFVLDYDTLDKIPITVYYHIMQSKLGSYGRYSFHNTFEINAANPLDYSYSGYDRGHMFPAASSHSTISAWQSFDMTNMTPQLPRFNRGLWKRIESFERKNCDPLSYIICGIVPQKYGTERWLNNKILIPKQFYKIIYNPRLKSMIGFVVEQDGMDPIQSYVKTVDYIELLTGIDFFYQLPISKQVMLESVICIEDWQW